jgi:hypothetical protein
VVVAPEPQAVVAAPAPQPHVQAPAAVAPVASTNGRTSSFEAALAAIRAAWVKPDDKASVATAPVIPAGTASEGTMPVSKPVGAGAVEVDLTGEIEALEEIEHEDRAQGEAPTADAPKAPAVQPRGDMHKKRPEKGRGGRKLRGSGGRPVQDEWGIFDPNQCGFSALVDKLDEVTDSDDAATRTVVTTRVISVR